MERLESECSCQLNDRTHITYAIYVCSATNTHVYTMSLSFHFFSFLFFSPFSGTLTKFVRNTRPRGTLLYTISALRSCSLSPSRSWHYYPCTCSTHKRADVYTRDAPSEVPSDSANYPEKVTYNFQSSNYSLQRSTMLPKKFSTANNYNNIS